MYAELLVIALILDAVFGEPTWLWSRFPHPVTLMGKAVTLLETRINRNKHRKQKGTIAMGLLAIGAVLVGYGLSFGGPIVELCVAAIFLAHKSLIDHVKAVATGLTSSLAEGRHALSMIVSRDTSDMSESDIVRSAIESGSENLSDGVIAPALWFMIFGLPGLMLYKITNTADSIVGYKTDRFVDYGWAAARLDDVLNWVPARITAIILMFGGWVILQFSTIQKDAATHKSPNAGWPEAAIAYDLGISLGGPRSYHGNQQDFPWLNPQGRKQLITGDIFLAIKAMWRAWVLFVIGIALLSMG